MAWRIDRDYIFEPTLDDQKDVGTASVKPFSDAPRYRFRLRDGDGEVYYGGWCDDAHSDESADWESSMYGCLKWGEWNAGATDFQLKAADAVKLGLATKAMVERSPDGWVTIFG